jgi:hypothetical protein
VRRFITSLHGKVVSQMVIMTLLLQSFTLALYAKANAQVAVLPLWAVTEFKNRKSPGTNFGKTAATAVASELGKMGSFDVIPEDTIKRAIETLGINSPPDGQTNLVRLAQEVHAKTIVSGEIVDYKVLNVGGGKQASVALKVTVYDVASGLPVNGSALQGLSTIRSGNVTDETLINDAISQASGQAIRDINSRTLPFETIFNTLKKLWLFEYDGIDEDLRGVCLRISWSEVKQSARKVWLCLSLWLGLGQKCDGL